MGSALLIGVGCAGGDIATSGFGATEGETDPFATTSSAGTEGGSITTSVGTGDSSSAGDTIDPDSGSTGGGSSSGDSDSGSSSGDTGEECVEEICDGFDNDCDDEIDEGCACTPDDTQPCYSGDPGTAGMGACQTGTQTCTRRGQWGATCEGEVTPTAETCNAIDDDCDGETDEDFMIETCGDGVCQQMVDTCDNGTPQVCTPLDPPDPVEDCEGTDDDCDGSVDEGCSCTNGTMQNCYPGPMGTQNVGNCVAGTQTCAGGQWGTCNDAVVPQNEVCDGDDDNCNGTDDDGTGGAACNTGMPGVCAQGLQQCNGGMLQCQQAVFGGNEICDGLDNDCDTGVDEGTGGAACMTGLQGICAAGTQQCTNGNLQCQQNFPMTNETCNDTDDDCDGTADEGNPGGGLACGTGQPGICAAGTTACSNGAIQCNQDVAAQMESCNATDDDCDGAVDNGNPGGGAGCATGLPGICSAGTTTCQAGALNCVQNQMAGAEICGDALDNDCDGTVNDGCGCAHPLCQTGAALVNGCDPCVSQVCAVDTFCCSNGWDSMCVGEVSSICLQQPCQGTCSHGLCVTGIPLVSGCDPAGCVTQICGSDPWCCNTSWDSICAGEVETICGLFCS